MKPLRVRDEFLSRSPIDDERGQRVDERIVREGNSFLGDLPSCETVVEGVDLGKTLLVVDEETKPDRRVCE